jgi:rhodanese-related sulfurtransferase
MKLTDIFRKVDSITPADARKLIDKNKDDALALIDVREPFEYEEGHIPGAELVPLSELPDKLQDMNKEKTTVAY